ncbi:unspecified product [Leishmania tarentolae]|uniref:Unspecified product n=1 Tax=Leishmania tarentolae TaxID=5689 RepID=A0A640K743_LEITA|nr:unspecified product [Leishmania tarentolae]
MVSIDVKDIRRNFYGNLEFLGITFDVIMHIWGPSSTPALAAPADAMRAASKPAQASAAAVRGTVAAAANLRPAALNCLARDPSHHGVALSLLGMDHHTGTQRTRTQGALDAMRCSAAERQQARGRTAVPTTPSSNTSFALFDLPEQTPAMPFAWSLPRNDAFPKVQEFVLKALTRKSYLSAYKRDVYVFADLTLDDLLSMLSIDLSPAPDKPAAAQARTASQAVSSTGAAVGEGAPAARVGQGHARSTAGLQEVSGTESEHYCHLLVTPEATLIRPPEGVNQYILVTRDGTKSYPPALVKVVQDVYHIDLSSDYWSITNIVSILCTLVVIALPACAALAYAHQVWRRRREKRADMRRLLQHDLR